MKIATYLGGLLGLAALTVLAVRANLSAIVHTLATASSSLLWLAPYRALFFVLYAAGWLILLRPYDPKHRAGLAYTFWVTTVRDGIDRLLPVASVGGSVVGIRLMTLRGIDIAGLSASVIVEIVLTLVAVYLFTALGLLILYDIGQTGHQYDRLLYLLVLTLPVPTAMLLLLRYGSVFGRLQKLLRSLIGADTLARQAVSLDRELRASMRRGWRLTFGGMLQFAAFISGTFEVWFALRLFGHPVSINSALILESTTQAARHLAFVVPAGIGVQEAGLVLFGHALGVSSELALAVSMVKRMRELLWGVPALLSWQWFEGWRLQKSRGELEGT